ncbi:hypothetical protein NKH77_04315 [Streptomyces sp. M19]
MLDAMSRAHPLNLLSRLGALQAVHGTASLALIGEADLTTCDELRAALDKSLAQTAGQHSCLTVDLGGLHFLGVASADELLRTVRRLGGRSRSRSAAPPPRRTCCAGWERTPCTGWI